MAPKHRPDRVESIGMQPVPSGKRPLTPWVDLIRLASMFLVVVIHVSGQLTNVWGQVPAGQWIIADVYGGLARVSVPLFFMISGYLLLPRSETLGVFFSRRILKLVIPLLVWSLIYLAWLCGGHPGTCTPGLIQNLLLVQGTYYHLWFLYSLLGIYLVLPVLRLIIRPDSDRRLLWYFIGLWLIFQPLWTILQQFGHIYINISAPMATNFLPYFFLGYLLGEIELNRLVLVGATALFVLGVFATCLGAYIMTRAAGQYNGFFYDFLSFNVIFAAGGVFVLLRRAGDTAVFGSPAVNTVTRSIATATFGIYLIHILVIEIIGFGIPFAHINSFMGNAVWTIPLVSLLVFLISYVLVRGMQRIPVLRQIVP